MWLGTSYKPVNVDQLPDLSLSYKPLKIAGSLLTLLGAIAVAVIALNWEVCVKATKGPSGAAQAATAAAGVVIIGAALFYAGMARRAGASASR